MTKESKWFVVIAAMFAIGIMLGCLYCAFVEDSNGLYEFLQNFIAGIKDGTDKTLVFRKSFISGMKFIGLFFICAMMKYGFVPICGITLVKSFSIGFTFAALFKYFGNNGIWIMLSQLCSNVLLFIVFVVFGAVCSGAGFKSKQRGLFIKIVVTFLISCVGIVVSSFVAGYVDAYILSMVAEKLY